MRCFNGSSQDKASNEDESYLTGFVVSFRIDDECLRITKACQCKMGMSPGASWVGGILVDGNLGQCQDCKPAMVFFASMELQFNAVRLLNHLLPVEV